jgi:hypothetical protein
MDRDRLLAEWRREDEQPFVGWGFSYLDGRMLEEQAPWSYSARAAELMRAAASVVVGLRPGVATDAFVVFGD